MWIAGMVKSALFVCPGLTGRVNFVSPPGPLIQAYDEADPSEVNIRTISRRDANAFARAARWAFNRVF